MDKYTFTVVIGDTGDEFSAGFNPKDEEHIEAFEDDVRAVIEQGNYYVESIALKKLETEF